MRMLWTIRILRLKKVEDKLASYGISLVSQGQGRFQCCGQSHGCIHKSTVLARLDAATPESIVFITWAEGLQLVQRLHLKPCCRRQRKRQKLTRELAYT